MTNTAAFVSLILLGSQTVWAHAELIRRAADPSTAPIEDVSIHHRSADILMSQKLLHRPNIIAILQKVGGEGVSKRVHGIRILVGAGLALPNQPLTPRRAQQAAPLRFRYHNDRQPSYPHHSLKSLFKIASVTPFLRNHTSFETFALELPVNNTSSKTIKPAQHFSIAHHLAHPQRPIIPLESRFST